MAAGRTRNTLTLCDLELAVVLPFVTDESFREPVLNARTDTD